jgi:hypothetical protein
MKNTVLTLCLVILLGFWVCASAGAAEDPAAKGTLGHFNLIKELAGEWTGTAGEAGAGGVPTTVRYALTAGGSAVTEVMFQGTPHEMLTVYTMDGEDLVLTHYCAMGNQPRMRASGKSGEGRIVFDFAGGGNLRSATDAHMHSMVLTLLEPDHIRAEWTFYEKGEPAGVKVFDLRRKSN